MINMQLHNHRQNRRLQLPLLLLLGLFSAATAHNITSLLSKHPEFATFNHYLTLTHLDAEINDRTTITVLAVDNAAMDTLLSTHPSINTLKNILSIHIILDYFGIKKLHQISDGSSIAATVFQATGTAPGTSGFVNITDLQGGKVGFGPQDNNGTLDTYLVKSVEELPYNISVLQISKILPSAVAAAPAPGPGDVNLTSLMSGHGCKEFADALSAVPDAFKTFQDTVVGGLTAFCPTDGAFRQFLPKYKNLTAANKVSFFEFYGIPIYMSMAMLRSNNGPSNTLATDGAKKFDFTIQNDGQGITLNTKINTVKVSSTVFDLQPLAVYALDGVLLSGDLFKAEPTPAPAPAPVKPAESPKHNSSSSSSTSAPATTSPSESPADSPDGDVADQTASNARVVGGGAAVVMSILLGFGVLMSQLFN